MIRHPADRSQWRNLNREYPQFDNDPRNIRFALSADGMNPYDEFGSAHSTWPVTLCMFNIPPWLCLKRKFIMMLVAQKPEDIVNVIYRGLRKNSMCPFILLPYNHQ